MKLPHAKRAVVDVAKVRDYLLSADHPVGRSKARVFFAVGYRRHAWPVLQRDLFLAARTMDVTSVEITLFGKVYVGTATLIGPTGVPLLITMVWIIRSGRGPRLVTAYPRNDE